MDAAEIAKHLGQGKEKRNRDGSWMTLCPSHDDRNPSLQITDAPHGLRYHCHAGCPWKKVKQDAESRWNFRPIGYHGSSGPSRRPKRDPAPVRSTTEYVYDNERGEPVVKVVRIDRVDGKKNFSQHRREGDHWVAGLNKLCPPLYRLPEVLGAVDQGATVFVVEGEKCVDRLRTLELCATTCAMGAGKWRDEYGAWLRGARVVILPDNDPPGRDHAKQVASALRDVAAEVKIVELPDLPEKGDVVDYLERGSTKEMLEDLVTRAPAEGGVSKPSIDASDRDVVKIAGLAWDALIRANDPPSFFIGLDGKDIVTIDEGQGQPRIVPLDETGLRYHLARVADWFVPTRGGGQRPDYPPVSVVRDMLARPDVPLPVLDRITEAPVFGRGGTLHSAPGYDPSTRGYFAPSEGLRLPAVHEVPSEGEREAARDLLLELFCDFPFVGDSDRAHALAMAILPFVRNLIAGPTPIHLVEAPDAGSGKTLLSTVALFPALGRDAALLHEGRDEEELRKRITALLRNGPTAIVIDNVHRRLDSASLAIAITGTWWEDRILGKTETVRLPVSCVWVVTGNNPTLSSEVARRAVRIRLNPKRDQPWRRDTDEFRHPDLRSWVREHRGDLIVAIHVLVQAWLARGKPVPPGVKPLGSFEDWSRVLGGILEVAGIPGFLGNLDEFYEASDEEGAVWRAFLGAWHREHGSSPVKTADLYALIQKGEIDLDLGRGTEQGQKVRLGQRIKQLRDRQFDLPGLGIWQVVASGSAQRATLWALVPARGSESEGGQAAHSPLDSQGNTQRFQHDSECVSVSESLSGSISGGHEYDCGPLDAGGGGAGVDSQDSRDSQRAAALCEQLGLDWDGNPADRSDGSVDNGPADDEDPPF